MVKSFPAPISAVEVVITAPNKIDVDTKELYTAIFTYDAGTQTSKMYVLDARTDNLQAYSEVETAIPGKVIRYLANQ